MSSSEKKEIYRRFASAGITLAIVLMLVLSGPAGAVKLHIDLDKTEVEQGKPLEFTVTSKIEARDSYVPIENYSVKINGGDTNNVHEIIFSPDGEIISNNNGGIIKISKVISKPSENEYGYGYGYGYNFGYGYGYNFGYGYGYGYGYGHGGKDINYSYNISIDTSTLTEGKYNIEFI
ncbi:MAG: hypothetical protein PHD26_09630, partial [Methanosarcinaceae archaeon]|nr:hypothetical protein [Methanosarcinaceae archaeon]